MSTLKAEGKDLPAKRPYDNERWRKKSRQQRREHPLCEMCLKQGEITPAEVADHVVPHRGDQQLFEFGELQSLCKWHHDSIKQQQEKSGYSSEVGLDGWPLDKNHPVYKLE